MKSNNQKFLAMLLLCVLVTISSCKKDDTTNPDDINGQVVSVQATGSGFAGNINLSINSTYDGNGRLTSQVQTNNGVTETTNYAYATGAVTETKLDSAGTITGTVVYTLNADGYTTSSDNGLTYTYDADGHQITYSGGSNTYTFTYTNGNNTAADYGGGGTATMTYLTDKTEYRDQGLGFMGKGSKNLVSVVTTYYNGNVAGTLTYTYQYDSKGRVSQMTMAQEVPSAGTQTTVYTYTYAN